MREAGRGTLLPPHSDDVGAASAWQMRPFTPAGSGLDPPREGPVVRIRFPPAESPCLTQTRPLGSAAWRSARGVLADELLHPLDRPGGVGGVGFAGHEAVI